MLAYAALHILLIAHLISRILTFLNQRADEPLGQNGGALRADPGDSHKPALTIHSRGQEVVRLQQSAQPFGHSLWPPERPNLST